jgi:hypothetical protein
MVRQRLLRKLRGLDEAEIRAEIERAINLKLASFVMSYLCDVVPLPSPTLCCLVMRIRPVFADLMRSWVLNRR